MALGSAFFVAGYLQAVPRAKASANGGNFFYAALLLAVSLPAAWAHPVAWTHASLGLALLYGAFTLVAQTLVVVGSRLTRPAVAAASTALIPVYASVLGWMLLGEKLSALEGVGILIVVACAAGVSLRKRPPGLPRFRWEG
jgi:drug/metabolite transporter (DMT)-like permease